MITFLSGGTGTPKLMRGYRTLMEDHEMTVIVNTAEDMWFSGSHLSPDLDTVMYLFADLLDTERWWGIEDDTNITSKFLEKIGYPEPVTLGDRDRAVNIARADMLRAGMTLTGATRHLSSRLQCDATILPMCDTEVTTCIQSNGSEMHFQEYWVKHRGAVPVDAVVRRCSESPVATKQVLQAIRDADAVIIGPSNPVTSISPILECEGVKDALKDQFVIVISPFIGDAPVSGPAAELMMAWDMAPNGQATYDLYRDFTDVFVQDIRDPVAIEGAVRLDTLMTDKEVALALAESIQQIIDTAADHINS
ncbi:2-phospho-L-lactate transferase [Methanogenium sp. MK-MG]|uniref:2-phospho-L-lactate transferase n=1 Tax=Methanogenium sp. MK-MG TaxID=2599926 RepID=UPI0013EA4E83|nr:2-phospho-L-lactate transferase [Methanogenium sp. MK-MG]KAF1076884.1 2-phospho-L-lactate transferase [Methanogenium sp. MK-MG]